MTPTPKVHRAYILAGGHSRRFGSDKARAKFADSTLLNHLLERLQQLDLTTIVIAQRPSQYADLGIETLADLVPDRGPVAGLATALAHYDDDVSEPDADKWSLVTSCDSVGFDAEWLSGLQRQLNRESLAILFRDDRWQPFPGLYHVGLLATIHRELACPKPSMQHLLDSAAERVQSVIGKDVPPLRFANTPEELAKWR